MNMAFCLPVANLQIVHVPRPVFAWKAKIQRKKQDTSTKKMHGFIIFVLTFTVKNDTQHK